MSITGKSFKADKIWIIELPDHVWHITEGEHRIKLIAEAKATAKSEGCVSVNIFTLPDPIFPINGNPFRVRVHSEQFASVSEPLYAIKTNYRAEIQRDIWERTPEHLRNRLIRTVRDDINSRALDNPGYYQIVVHNDDKDCVVEKGRV